MLELFEVTVIQKMRQLLRNSLFLVFFVSGFFVIPHQALAACSVVRDAGGFNYCDYNTNFQVDLGETTYSACSANPPQCCETPTECSPASSGNCNPGSGFIPLGDCLKLSDDTKVSETYTTPAFLVNLLVRNLFVVAGIILFFMILLAGFKFIAGGKKGLDDAKQIMSAALIGFLLMFSAYWIVQIVKLITRTNIVL